jgi:hypothetical protein
MFLSVASSIICHLNFIYLHALVSSFSVCCTSGDDAQFATLLGLWLPETILC